MNIEKLIAAKNSSDYHKEVFLDESGTSSYLLIPAGVMLGFYLYDAVYALDIKSIAVDAGRKMSDYPILAEKFRALNVVLGAVAVAVIFPIIVVAMIETYPAKLYLFGFRRLWKRTAIMVFSTLLSIFIVSNLYTIRTQVVLLIAYGLFMTTAAIAHARIEVADFRRRED